MRMPSFSPLSFFCFSNVLTFLFFVLSRSPFLDFSLSDPVALCYFCIFKNEGFD